MGCPRRQAHTRNQISRGDTASVFGCRVPLDWGGRQGWLQTAHCFHKSLMNGWKTARCTSVSGKVTGFEYETKRWKRAQSNWLATLSAAQRKWMIQQHCKHGWMQDYTLDLFIYFCLLPIFWLSACIFSGKEPICDISIYTCWTLHTPETMSMLRHNLATETKKK